MAHCNFEFYFLFCLVLVTGTTLYIYCGSPLLAYLLCYPLTVCIHGRINNKMLRYHCLPPQVIVLHGYMSTVLYYTDMMFIAYFVSCKTVKYIIYIRI